MGFRMQFPTRALVVNLALIALFAVSLLPVMLIDPESNRLPAFMLPLPVAAFPGLLLALWAVVDAVRARGDSTALRVASGLAGVVHGIGWGSWALLQLAPVANPINITGIIGPGLGSMLSLVAVGCAIAAGKSRGRSAER